MKKTIAVLLLVMMVLGVVACGKQVEAPSGFQVASIDSDPFYLYVPNTWTSNASSGISSAYCSTAGSVLVSAFAQKNEEGIMLEQYTAKMLESFQRTLEDFVLATKNFEETVLGSYKAYCFDYNATSGDRAMVFRTYVSNYAEGFAVLTYSAEKDAFAIYEEDFDEIVSKFTFKVENEDKIPAKDEEPEEVEGWQLATNIKYEYDFYVPKTWTVDRSSEVPTVYCADNREDTSNVTLMSYVLSEPMTAVEYWEKTKGEILYDYTVVSTDDQATLGGISAMAVEYNMDLAGLTYRIKQVFCATSNMVYVFTYTSDDTYYERHLSAVNETIAMFEFH